MRTFTAVLLLAMGPAFAQTATQILPPNPKSGDAVTIQFATPGMPCPTLAPNGVLMAANNIGVEVTRGNCFAPAGSTGTGRVTLGRFPAGSYTVQVTSPNPGDFSSPPAIFANATFTVGVATPVPIDEDLSGHWLTDNPGEGLSITQYGDRAFIVLNTYDPATGHPRWVVFPDVKRDMSQVIADGPLLLVGVGYLARNLVTNGPPSAFVGDIYEWGRRLEIAIPTLGYDRAQLTLRDMVGSPPAAPRVTEIRRFRF